MAVQSVISIDIIRTIRLIEPRRRRKIIPKVARLRMTKSSDRRASGKLFVAVREAVKRLVVRCREATSSNRYRPEKHYMRGAGPKSSRKAPEGDQNSR
jgi:hypothetical protein